MKLLHRDIIFQNTIELNGRLHTDSESETETEMETEMENWKIGKMERRKNKFGEEKKKREITIVKKLKKKKKKKNRLDLCI